MQERYQIYPVCRWLSSIDLPELSTINHPRRPPYLEEFSPALAHLPPTRSILAHKNVPSHPTQTFFLLVKHLLALDTYCLLGDGVLAVPSR